MLKKIIGSLIMLSLVWAVACDPSYLKDDEEGNSYILAKVTEENNTNSLKNC